MKARLRTTPRRALSLAVATVLTASGLALLTTPASATACSGPAVWQGGSSTDWTDANNWQGGVPDSSTSALIPSGMSPTITNVGGSVCGITIGNDTNSTGAVTLNGHLDGFGVGGIVVRGSETLTLTGGSFSLAGVTMYGDTAGGAVTLGAGTTAVLGGTTTINNLDLHFSGDQIDATTASTIAASGSATFFWDAGTMAPSSDLTLNVLTKLTGSATRTVGSQAKLTLNQAMEVMAGSLVDNGQITSHLALRFFPQTSVSGSGSISNPSVGGLTPGQARPVLAFGPGSPGDTPTTGTVSVTGVTVDNAENIEVTSGTNVTLGALTATLEPGAILAAPLETGTSGTLTIGNGATVNVSGSTTMKNGFTLKLDDGADGTHATLHGATADASLTGTVTSTQPVPGAVTWASGSVTGPLKLDGVTTTVTSATGSGRFLDGLLKLSGPANIGAASAVMRQGAGIQIFGQTTLSAPGARFDPAPGTTGQSITVESGGTLRRVPQSSTASTAPGEYATINVPLLNQGRVELDASLDAPGGYSQTAPATLATGAAPPITALLGGSTLRSGKSIGLTGGGVGGKGTISTPTLNLTNTWIGPGYRANCHEVKSDFAETCVGTITVAGALALHSGADVQVVARGATAYDQLIVTKGASLTGKLTVATGTGYKPAYGIILPNVVKYASRTNAFTSVASPAAPVGFGWRASYDDVADSDGRGVDVKLVDTQAPTLGFAGIPAFTQQTVLEVAYAAVDNKSGVASYDVRWHRAALTGPFQKWVYPKTWQHTTKRVQVITGLAEGYTYCASVRARDRAGNVSAWTAAPCSALELDDRFLRATGPWTRATGKTRFFDKTYSRTTVSGSTLSKYGTYARIAVSAYRCPTCGTLKIYSGGVLMKTWVLASAKYGKVNWVSPAVKLRTGRVTLRAVGRHKMVQIDALGLLR